MIDVISLETYVVVYKLFPTDVVYRYEPRDAPTPMMPHKSMYAPYGRFEFGYKHLFCAEQRALDELHRLREGQGYFEADVVLRSETIGNLIRKCGKGAVVLEDQKFNFTVLGAGKKGALIVTMPIGNTGA